MALIQGSMPRRNLNAKVELTLESRDSLLLKNFFFLTLLNIPNAVDLPGGELQTISDIP